VLISKRQDIKKRTVRNISAVVIATTVLFFLLFSFKEKISESLYNDIIIRTHIKSMGIGGLDRKVTLFSIIKDLGRNVLSFNSEKQKIENLIIDIKFEDFQKLKKNRKYAIEDGMIDKTHFESVNAKLRIGDSKYKAKLRLKGFYLDHLATEKWSLKIKIKGDNIDGMREFTINAPHTRDFHSSILINDAMEYKKILAQKDGYLNVIINGKNIGTMYYEERYSEQFTERARKPFGPILSFDEKSNTHSFSDEKKFWSNDRNLQIAASNIESLLNDPANNLDIINQNSWAEYIAITFLFKCFHGNVGINLSHYFHPINKQFEPISSDNSCGQKEIGRKFGYLPHQGEFIYKLMSTDSFKERLHEKLLWWYESQDAKNFISEMNIKEKILRRTLLSDAPLLQKFAVSNNHIPEVLEWIKDIEKSELVHASTPNGIPAKHKSIPQLTVLKSNEELIFSASEFSRERYILGELVIKFPEKREYVKLSNNIDHQKITDKINSIASANASKIAGMSYTFMDSSRKREHEFGVNLFYSQNEFNPFKDSKIKDISKFFILDESTNNLFTKKNTTLTITETLIIPDKYTLTINSGTRLSFIDKAGLVVKGAFRVDGTDKNPVIFKGSNNWSGVLVLANGSGVVINNLNVSGGTGLINGVSHRGAFTINNADVKIHSSTFMDNYSEDALNLVEVRGLLDAVTISNTKSDGLDVDYGDIEISNSKFVNIGNSSGADAVDISKTNLKIRSSFVSNVTDKGISVGENSKAEISNVIISNAFVGVVAKDSSEINMSNVYLDSIYFADTMSYQKKPHFGGASITATNLESSLNNHIVQNKSSSVINGENIRSKKIDIDSLYNTVMESIK